MDRLAVQYAAQPGAGQAGDRDGDRVPKRTELGLGDRDHHASDTGQKPDEAEDQSVTHRRVGGEPRRDVAAQDGVDDAIGSRQSEEPVGHRLAPRRYTRSMCSPWSVPSDRTTTAANPATTAPVLRQRRVVIWGPPKSPPAARRAGRSLPSRPTPCRT